MKTIEFGAIKKVKVALTDPSEPRNMRTIAVLSWRVLIIAAALSVLVSIGLSFLKFEATLQTLEGGNEPTPGAATKFNRADFDATVKAFGDRQVRYQVTEAAPPSIADPSL